MDFRVVRQLSSEARERCAYNPMVNKKSGGEWTVQDQTPWGWRSQAKDFSKLRKLRPKGVKTVIFKNPLALYP